MTLSGCAAKPDKVPPIKDIGVANPYPPLPADQVRGCGEPPYVVGVKAKIAWARAEKWGEDCSRLQKRGVKFYTELRKTKPQTPEKPK